VSGINEATRAVRTPSIGVPHPNITALAAGAAEMPTEDIVVAPDIQRAEAKAAGIRRKPAVERTVELPMGNIRE
jgi:hypothetical protein